MASNEKRLVASMQIFRAMLLIVLVAISTGCSRSEPEAQAKLPSGALLLNGAGATFPSVLYNRWFRVYQDSHPNIVIKYAVVGSGEGVRRFIGKNVAAEETVDFGASDAAMSDLEIERADNNALMIPATAGCVVLAYNLPGVQGRLNLSRKAYAGIFLGQITKWNDPLIAKSNPGVRLPGLSIVNAVRQDGSGTTFAFTKHLDAINEEWRNKFVPGTLIAWPGNAMRAKGNEAVAGLISNSEGAVGYVGYEFARQLGLHTAALENKDGSFVEPSQRGCRRGLTFANMPENLRAFVSDPDGLNSYPIVTFSWVLVRKKYKNAETAKVVRELFQWSLKDGQQYAPELGYIQLPGAVAEKAQAALNKIEVGADGSN